MARAGDAGGGPDAPEAAPATAPEYAPLIAPLGLDGLIVRFADHLSEPANRAALAFRAALEAARAAGDLPAALESATSLASAYLRFDPLAVSWPEIEARVAALLGQRDWYAAPLPEGRRRLTIPCVFDDSAGPGPAAGLRHVAEQAGLDRAATIAALCAPVRVMTIGFAPGFPYMGELPPGFAIPRRSGLQQVPAGAVGLAIRQLVIFPNGSPTGWHHVGQTAFRPFQPEAPEPFALRPGDEVELTPVEDLRPHAGDPMGGARIAPLGPGDAS